MISHFKAFIIFAFEFVIIIESRKTPLALAAISDKEKVADLLIRNGATVDVQDDAQKTPLLLAIDNGNASYFQESMAN